MKFICFDIGNVLCHLKFDNFLKCLSKNLDINENEAMAFVNKTQKLHDLGITKISEEMSDTFGIKSKSIIDEVIKEWNNVLILDEYMISSLSKLTESGYKIALLSNMGVEHKQFLSEKLKNELFFKSAIKHFSCDVGARKPSLLYYQSFLTQHPEFKGSLYIDDIMENLESAVNFGFQSRFFTLENNDHNEKKQLIKEILGKAI